MVSNTDSKHVNCIRMMNCLTLSCALTHWGQVTHICVSEVTIIGSDNGLSPGRRQAIIWTNDRILLIRTFRTYFKEIVSEIHTFSFKKMHFKMSSGKWRPSCLGLNVLSLALSVGISLSFIVTIQSRFNTLRPRQNGRHFPDGIFKWIFLNENVWISINISLKFVPNGPINNIPTLV